MKAIICKHTFVDTPGQGWTEHQVALADGYVSKVSAELIAICENVPCMARHGSNVRAITCLRMNVRSGFAMWIAAVTEAFLAFAHWPPIAGFLKSSSATQTVRITQ